MAFSTYTRDELRNIVVDHIKGRVTGANTSPGSEYWHLANAIATVVHGDQAAATYLVKQILPSTAAADWVALHASLRGLEPLPATKAQGKIIVRASSGSGITIPDLSALTHSSGQAYKTVGAEMTALPGWSGKTAAPGTSRDRIVVNPNTGGMAVDDVVLTQGGDYVAIKSIVPATGTGVAFDLYAQLVTAPASGHTLTPVEGVVCTVLADEAGAAGNLRAGDTLTLSSPPSGIVAACTVLEMSGGGDLESTEELRQRIIAWMQERPGSGNRADFRDWARQTPGVRLADAFVYPAYRGPGTVDVIPFGVSGARLTGTVVNDLVQAELEAQASFSDDVLVRALTEPTDITITATLSVARGYEADFTGTMTTAASGSTTSVVEVTSISDVEVGDRVLIATPTIHPRVWQRTVTGILTGPYRLQLDEPLPELPTASSTVRPGGPAAQGAIDALATLFDDLGPGDTDPSTRYPSPSEAYPSQLSRAAIIDALMDVDGVVNVQLSAPASDQSPASLVRLRIGSIALTFVEA